MCGPKSNLPKQLAKQKKAHGGELDRQVVSQVVLHLAWESYQSVGHCLHACRRWVRNSLPDEPSGEELALYDQWYQSQAYLADFPLALIAERLTFLRPAILELWQAPQTSESIGVLHRMMEYYGQLAGDRRAVDLRGKQNSALRSRAAEASGEPSPSSADGAEVGPGDDQLRPTTGREVPLGDDAIASGVPLPDDIRELTAHMAELHNAQCSAGCQEWEYAITPLPNGVLEIAIICECPAEPRRFTTTEEELERAWRKLHPPGD